MAAVRAGYDLGVIALCVLALGLLLTTKGLAKALAAVFEYISIFGYKPFGFIADALDGSLIGWLDDAIAGVETVTARFFSGMIDSFAVLIGFALIVMILVKDALAYLWNQALQPLIGSHVDPVRTIADEALAKAETLPGIVARDLTEAKDYAETQASGAYRDAVRTLRPDIAAGVAAAERYASDAVEKLRTAEDTALGQAVAIAVEAQAAGLAAAAQAASTAEGVAAQALAQADAAGKAALAGVKAIAIDVQGELNTIEQAAGAAGVVGLLASIPALATLVHAIATEAGLSNAECRSKVNQVCGTNPAAWAGLLAGAAFLTGNLSLRDLIVPARLIFDGGKTLIDEAA